MRRSLHILILLVFCPACFDAYCGVLPYMPSPGSLVTLSREADLPLPLAIEFDKANPLKISFILSRCGNCDKAFLEGEARRIAKYFFSVLALPAQDLWVNLSPYEQNLISTDELSRTELGQDLLGEDYVLKQLAASLTHPESEAGKKYWRSINSEPPPTPSLTKRGSGPTQSFNKVWIVPGEMLVEESKDKAKISKAVLRVMTEEDYSAMQNNNVGVSSKPTRNNGQVTNLPLQGSNINAFKTHILPLIEREVNSGERFARLRQIYYATILAGWFKHKLQTSVLSKAYFDVKKTKGVNCQDPAIREKIYNEYLASFNQGAYDYVKKESAAANKTIRRHYFCGGMQLESAVHPPVKVAPSIGWPSGSRADLMAIPIIREPLDEGSTRLTYDVPAGAIPQVIAEMDVTKEDVVPALHAKKVLVNPVPASFIIDRSALLVNVDASSGEPKIATDLAGEFTDWICQWIVESIVADDGRIRPSEIDTEYNRQQFRNMAISVRQALSKAMIKGEIVDDLCLRAKNHGRGSAQLVIPVFFTPDGSDMRIKLGSDFLTRPGTEAKVFILRGIRNRVFHYDGTVGMVGGVKLVSAALGRQSKIESSGDGFTFDTAWSRHDIEGIRLKLIDIQP